MRRPYVNAGTLGVAATIALTVAATGCGGEETSGPTNVGGGGSGPTGPTIDLRADSNRDGIVDLADPSDDVDEDVWDASHGAIFMANIDDDLETCPDSNTLSDAELAACNDAADEVVNGPDDLLDMARLMIAPWPEAPEDASATLALSAPGADHVRLFLNDAGNFALFPPGTVLTAQQLRQGVELAIEGKDIVRDEALWDGYLDVTLAVDAGTAADGKPLADGSDSVRLRLAPVLTSHNLQASETLFVSKVSYSEYAEFRKSIAAAVTASEIPGGLVELPVIGDDVWTQDFFEVGYMTMPAPGDQQHVISVYMRSASNWGASGNSLRPSGKLVFTYFRGKDAAGIDQHGPENGNGLDDGGNLETIPPYDNGGESYPFGRIVRGSSPSYHPTTSFDLMLRSQKIQAPLEVDTSWLAVGHIDETLSYVKASSPRGWALAANDPALAIQMLQDAATAGHGDVQMFVGMNWYDDQQKKMVPAAISIQQVLDDPDLMAENAQATIDVADQIDTLKQETGITEAEIIPIPFLHWEAYGYSVAYQPGTTNSIILSDTDFGAPNTHGPLINGKDIFAQQLDEVFAPYGITVHLIENWHHLHMWMGEVHCGSNTLRAVPADVRWWESGR